MKTFNLANLLLGSDVNASKLSPAKGPVLRHGRSFSALLLKRSAVELDLAQTPADTQLVDIAADGELASGISFLRQAPVVAELAVAVEGAGESATDKKAVETSVAARRETLAETKLIRSRTASRSLLGARMHGIVKNSTREASAGAKHTAQKPFTAAETSLSALETAKRDGSETVLAAPNPAGVKQRGRARVMAFPNGLPQEKEPPTFSKRVPATGAQVVEASNRFKKQGWTQGAKARPSSFGAKQTDTPPRFLEPDAASTASQHQNGGRTVPVRAIPGAGHAPFWGQSLASKAASNRENVSAVRRSTLIQSASGFPGPGGRKSRFEPSASVSRSMMETKMSAGSKKSPAPANRAEQQVYGQVRRAFEATARRETQVRLETHTNFTSADVSPPVVPGTNSSGEVPIPVARVEEIGPAVGREVFRFIDGFNARSGEHTAEVRIHPPELGSVAINVRVKARSVSIELTVENREVKVMLDAQVDGLRADLSEKGFTLDGFDVGTQENAKTHQHANNTHNYSRANEETLLDGDDKILDVLHPTGQLLTANAVNLLV